MKILKCLGMCLVIFNVGCRCLNSECNGAVVQTFEVSFQDKSTGQPLNVSASELKCVVTGLPALQLTRNSTSDVSFSTGNNFLKEGTSIGTIEVNQKKIGTFSMTLISAPCCNGYPESGSMKISEGDLVVQPSNWGNINFMTASAKLIAKL